VAPPDASQQPVAAAAASRLPSSDGTPLPSVAEQISPAMIAMVQGRNAARSVSVSITPGELGQVNITVERSADGTTSIHVAAERLATLDMLRTGQADLSHALNQAGVQQSSHSLSFSWNGAPGSGNQGWTGQGWSGQGGNGQGWHGQAWARSDGQSDDALGALAARSYAEDRTGLGSTAAARGGIDVTA
jgi:flagellar hook-length control protein FliK